MLKIISAVHLLWKEWVFIARHVPLLSDIFYVKLLAEYWESYVECSQE